METIDGTNDRAQQELEERLAKMPTGVMATGCQVEPKKQEFQGRVDVVKKQLEMLDNEISQLETRLSTVLTPERQGETTDDKGENPSTSYIDGSMTHIQRVLVIRIGRIRELAQRVDL